MATRGGVQRVETVLQREREEGGEGVRDATGKRVCVRLDGVFVVGYGRRRGIEASPRERRKKEERKEKEDVLDDGTWASPG